MNKEGESTLAGAARKGFPLEDLCNLISDQGIPICSHTSFLSSRRPACCVAEAHIQNWFIDLKRWVKNQRQQFRPTMADLASLAKTNCLILSFSSGWTQRTANSHSDLLGVHDPHRKAQRIEPISSIPPCRHLTCISFQLLSPQSLVANN